MKPNGRRYLKSIFVKSVLSLLLLLSTAWAQQAPQEPLRLRPPFVGLIQSLNQTDMPNNGFYVFSNAAVTKDGEIYKRGGFSHVPGTTDTLGVKIDIGGTEVAQLYRYYKSYKFRRLLALTDRSNNFAHWYWLNDTTGRFAYSVAAADTVDTMSQVGYRKGRVSIRQNANENAVFIIGTNDSTRFFSQGSNLSNIKTRFIGGTDPSELNINASVWVVNDTLLAFQTDSLDRTDITLDTITNRRYELQYRNASSGGVIFHANAMTHLDTLYFSRSMHDPIAWDGSQTNRTNILDAGTADTLRDSTLVDLGKTWTANQWAGYWLFKTNASHRENPATTGCLWRTNWVKIKGNTANTLIVDSTKVLLDATAAKGYAIVSMPIDEPMWINLADNGNGDSSMIVVNSISHTPQPDVAWPLNVNITTHTRKYIFATPIQAFVLDGVSAGQLKQVSKWHQDSVFLTRGMSSVAGGDRVMFLRSRFPIAKIIEKYKERTLYISDTTYQNAIYISKPGQPGWVEPNTQLTVNPNDGEFIQSAWVEPERVVLGKSSKLYEAAVRSIETSGENPDIWQINMISNSVGCESPKSPVQRGGTTWFFDWPEGFYRMSGNKLDLISGNIRQLIDSITPSAREKVWGVFYPAKKGGMILWGVPIIGSSDSLLCNRILCYSPDNGAWSTWDISNTNTIHPSVAIVQEGSGDGGEMILGLSDSAYIMRYNPNSNQDSLRLCGLCTSGNQGDFTKTFSLIMETKRFEIPDQRLRFTSFDPIVFNGGSATVDYKFYKNLATSESQQIVISHSAGWTHTKKSVSDAVLGNLLGLRITTSSPQSFRFGGVDINFQPAGRRLPE